MGVSGSPGVTSCGVAGGCGVFPFRATGHPNPERLVAGRSRTPRQKQAALSKAAAGGGGSRTAPGCGYPLHLVGLYKRRTFALAPLSSPLFTSSSTGGGNRWHLGMLPLSVFKSGIASSFY
jgi:hypothetical protein